MKINELTKESYKEFKNVVDQVRKQSHGIPYGVEIKIPSKEEEQLPILINLCQQIFPQEKEKTKHILG